MKTNKTVTLNIPISKIDEEQRIVTGIATSEMLDSQGDIVDYKASKKAFSEWAGNIREMHQDVAIGKGVDVQYNDKDKQVIVSAKISESADGENAWTKIKEEILTGFSIGGKVFEVVKDKAVAGANRITDYALSELSLVDNPANPEAELIMVKSMDGGLQRVEKIQDPHLPLPEAWWVSKFVTPDVKKASSTKKNAKTDLKKDFWGVSTIVSLAIELSYFLQSEVSEGDTETVNAIQAALDSLKTAAESELNEDNKVTIFESIEYAQGVVDLCKSKEKEVKKTNPVAGEERNTEAQVTETAEQSGRPVNDTHERAAAAGVPEVGAVVEDKKGNPELDDDGNEVIQDREYADDDKTKTPDDTARNDITPPQDKKVVSDKDVDEALNEQTIDSEEQTVNDTKQDRSPAIALPADPTKEEESVRTTSSKPTNTSEPNKGDGEDEKKTTVPTNLLKNVETLLTKLNDEGGNAELKKTTDAIKSDVGKVVKSMTALEDRIKKLEDQPLPTQGKQYQVIGKGDEEGEVSDDLKALQKRQEELMANPHDAKPGEMYELAKKLRKAHIGEPITIS